MPSGCRPLLGAERKEHILEDEKCISGKGPAEGLRAIVGQVLQEDHTREHMVRIGLIPLSSLVTEGTLVLGRGWELPRISHALLE